ncbi:hypothetical protein DM01DRAFT_1400230 [Hesseltinella vesiculosa]|uniref:Uncharacterized protein n=1 Tax=Hesseltinella vesiculosa TaxID=101127 RepID=A0A1X2GQ69_9FUNG|nr:hypothetical protein DM01DRAFT_1400230 [Hesseltinella vesiculosa]
MPKQAVDVDEIFVDATTYAWPIDDFLYDWYVKVSWIALSTLFVLWGLCWVCRHILNANDSMYVGHHEPPQNTNAVAAEMGQVGAARMDRSHDLIRDLLLMLLTVLTINTFARGSTRAVMVISWLFVAFAVIFVCVETVFKNGFVRLFYTLIFYALALAVIGLAWRYGF